MGSDTIVIASAALMVAAEQIRV